MLLSADAAEFDSQYGHSDGYSLADALWTCSNMFAKAYVVSVVILQSCAAAVLCYQCSTVCVPSHHYIKNILCLTVYSMVSRAVFVLTHDD